MTGIEKNNEFVATPEPQFGHIGARGPDASERSPIPNMDLATFRNWLMRALSGDQNVPPAILTRVNDAIREHGSDATKREREWWQNYFWQQAIQDNLHRIQELIETKRAERDQLLADIRDDERLLALYDAHKQGRERAEHYRDLHGAYELNENGELADADAEDMLKTWERRTGRKLDRNNIKNVQDAFREQQQYEDGEALRLQRELQTKRERVGTLGTEIEELESAEKKAETDLKNGVDPQAINADLQRELITKGHGTEQQKRKLASDQGIALSKVQIAAQMNDDEFDQPSSKAAFNQNASVTQPKAQGIIPENAVNDGSPSKQPVMNLNG